MTYRGGDSPGDVRSRGMPQMRSEAGNWLVWKRGTAAQAARHTAVRHPCLCMPYPLCAGITIAPFPSPTSQPPPPDSRTQRTPTRTHMRLLPSPASDRPLGWAQLVVKGVGPFWLRSAPDPLHRPARPDDSSRSQIWCWPASAMYRYSWCGWRLVFGWLVGASGGWLFGWDWRLGVCWI